MELSYLIEKLDKLIFINDLIYNYGIESTQALYTLTDEIKQLEEVYLCVRDELKKIL